MLVKGKKALLIAEGCKLNKEKKTLETRLGQIKAELGIDEAGTYTNDAGDELNVAESVKFSDVSPKTVMEYLKKQKKAGRFVEVVKVQIAALKRVVPESVVEKWRDPLDVTLRFTWK